MAQPVHVLLVEDDRDYAQMVATILKTDPDQHYEVTIAATWADTQRKLADADFDVIALDLMLPDSLGVNTLDRVMQAADNIPIVIVSGIDDKQAIFDAMVRGAQDYLIKNEHLPKLLTHALRHAIERQAVEKALQESENRYRTIFEHAADAILIVDPATAGSIDANPAARRLLGGSDTAQVRSLTDFVDTLCVESATALLRDIRKTGSRTFQWQATNAAGQPIHVEACCSPAPLAGQTYVLIVMHDVTERRAVESARRKLESQIQRAQKVESLGVLAGGMAHDFNNLLMGVLGNADLATLELEAESTAYRRVTAIKSAAIRAAELCRQMLAYSGQSRFVASPINLSDAIRDIEQVAGAMISKQINVVYDLDAALPVVEGDAAQIRQMILSLLHNAGEAIGSQPGTITIRTGPRRCEPNDVQCAYLDAPLPGGDYVFLEISDTGCGISDEVRERMFDPFFTTKFTGRGLGLAAVLGILRGHHGALQVESEVGKGSRFRVLLPQETSRQTPVETGADADAIEQARQRILIADDDTIVLKLAADMVHRMGFSPLTATTAAEAVNLFREHQDHVAAALLDVTLSDMGGYETGAALREMDPNVCIVLLSSSRNPEATARLTGALRPAGLVHKPFELSVLRAELLDIMKRSG